ncbi:MAG TPA: hypothetical protein VNV60_04275 [Holophagaceae bacterium]|jgi:hypothetical protein|nr:hypothetical protein [Holophagaceae bacterium]
MVIAIIGLLLTLIGMPAAYFAVLPRMSITMDTSSFPRNPLRNPLVVRNEGYVSFSSETMIYVEKLVAVNGNELRNAMIAPARREIRDLKPADSRSIDLALTVAMPDDFLVSFDLTVVSQIKAEYWPWKFRVERSYEVVRGSDGAYRWIPRRV